MAFGLRRKAKAEASAGDVGVPASEHLNRDVMKAMKHAAERGMTGSIAVTERAHGTTGHIYLYEGEVYSVLLDGYRPPVLQRLRSSDAIDESVMKEAQEVAVFEEWLVEHENLSAEDLGRVHQEISLAALSALVAAPRVKVKVHEGETTDRNCSVPLPVEALLTTLELRRSRELETCVRIGVMSQPGDVVLGSTGADVPGSGGLPEFGPFLDVVDGATSLDDVARACGYTRAEALHLARLLILQGSVRVTGSDSARRIDHEWSVPEEFGTRPLAKPPTPVAVTPVPDVDVSEAAPDLGSAEAPGPVTSNDGATAGATIITGAVIADSVDGEPEAGSVFGRSSADFTFDGAGGDDELMAGLGDGPAGPGAAEGEESSPGAAEVVVPLAGDRSPDQLRDVLRDLVEQLRVAEDLNRRAADQMAALRESIDRIEAMARESSNQ